LLNIDACFKLNIEFDTGIIFYFQIDSKTESFVDIFFNSCKYSGSEIILSLYLEIIITLCSEINSEANKQYLNFCGVRLPNMSPLLVQWLLPS